MAPGLTPAQGGDLSAPLYNPDPAPLLIVISGPSGVGKDTIVFEMEKRGVPFHFVVTATTRERRENETHGVDYLFMSKDEFATMIDEDELLEYAFVYKDYKGIPKQQVRDAFDSGKDVIMRVDVQGAATIKRKFPEALLIFLTTETEEELVQRLRARKTDTEEQLNLRIAMARQELKRLDEFDYVVLNNEGEIDHTVDAVLSIIDAEHHRVQHRKVSL